MSASAATRKHDARPKEVQDRKARARVSRGMKNSAAIPLPSGDLSRLPHVQGILNLAHPVQIRAAVALLTHRTKRRLGLRGVSILNLVVPQLQRFGP